MCIKICSKRILLIGFSMNESEEGKMLELKGIKKDYHTGISDVWALKGIDLRFRDCEFVSILGQSGCGKTTLLNIIGGLDQYTEGDLKINNKSTKNVDNF